MPGTINELTDSQKRCLDLAARHLTSKQIAIETGLSPMTVDQYFSRAAAVLGVTNRREAVRIYLELLAELPFKEPEFKPEAVVPLSNLTEQKPPQAEADPAKHSWLTICSKALRKLTGYFGGAPHDLNKLETIRAILWTALIATGVLTSIITVSAWLNYRAP